MRLFAVLVLVLAGVLSLRGQQAPYDVVPPAEPPYYRVRYEPSNSTQPGELIFPVSYTVWVPAGVTKLRGVIVHQHGCGVGSCKSGLTGAFDLHWQALARKHGCALLSPVYEQPEKADCQMWCDPRNGSDAAFQKGLADLAVKSGHPELATVPWALWGHSGGGHWAGGMVLLHPERVAAAWLRSGVPLLKADSERTTIKPHAVPETALEVPIMCNLGTKEGFSVKEGQFAGVWPTNLAFFTELRAKNGRIGIAIDPLTSHECGNQRYLAVPWFDACLSARLPSEPGAPLRVLPDSNAILARLPAPGQQQAAPQQGRDFIGDKKEAIWLPSEAISQAWIQYVTDTKVADVTPPPSPTNLKVNGQELTWDAEADLESGLEHFIIERDGQPIGTVPDQPKNAFGRPIFQGLQYSDTPTQPLLTIHFTDAEAEAGMTYRYRVIAVNTVGLQSQ